MAVSPLKQKHWFRLSSLIVCTSLVTLATLHHLDLQNRSVLILCYVAAIASLHILVASFRDHAPSTDQSVGTPSEQQLAAARTQTLQQIEREFRTPLTTITAISEALLDVGGGCQDSATDNTDRHRDADQREFLRDIHHSALDVLNFVNDISDCEKASAGAIRLIPQPVALIDLMDRCLAMLTPRAEEKGLTLTAQVDDELTEVIADPIRLRQITLKLISNAIKNSQSGGMVIVQVRPDEGRCFRITVRDTGQGMTSDQMKHLFDPFVQSDDERQGIGQRFDMAIVKHLVELHGGSIDVQSVLGSGTRLMVRIPRTCDLANRVHRTPEDRIAPLGKRGRRREIGRPQPS
ncbi:HAMP domain-containing sensor histidine kinase [Roseiconus lacunae]|uniref:sensor histidine kinase n=1 Tax=Roseiconus lacunae TaxID=2605694 RepID=UPI00308A2752|nr:HAMP domain-containing sensor histidine kinase [Stieleria sp. HD01]